MAADTYSRKWQITINNPIEKGYTHEKLRDILGSFGTMSYWCLSDEIGEEGTFHTHIFFVCASVVRFSTVKKKFDGGHFEMAHGTSQENKDYVFKQGKWLHDKKVDTNIADSHEEYGEMPIERQGKRNDLVDLYDMISSGMSTAQIIESDPNYITLVERIEKTRNVMLQEKFRKTRRLDLQVTYIYGPPECGKTRYVRDLFGDENVYSVDDYNHPFDGYTNQSVMFFDEFRNSLPLASMLKYLDIYPCDLPSRFYNKTACYNHVFIASNWSLEKQYTIIQKDDKISWNAFIRRIHNVMTFKHGNFITQTPAEYFQSLSDFVTVRPSDTPFHQESMLI